MVPTLDYETLNHHIKFKLNDVANNGSEVII